MQDLDKVKEIVSIAAALILCGPEWEYVTDVVTIDYQAAIIHHRIDAVLRHRENNEALYD